MPFIGTTPAQGFASSVNKQSFTANGSTTSFTLTHPVSNANDLEVFVGNVRQEPTAAYTASGTTLDFGSGNAPPNGVNLYVVYKGLAQVTTTPPDGSVGTGKIAANAVTVGKLATSGSLPALDGSALTNLTRTSATNSLNGVASSSITGLSTTARKITLLTHDASTSSGTNMRFRVRGNNADETGSVYSFNSFYIISSNNNNYVEGSNTDYFSWHSGWAGAANTYNIIVNFYKVGTGLHYNFFGMMYNRGAGGSNYSNYNTQFQGRILPSNLIDGITAYTADGANFDSGTMTVITNE